MKFVPTHVITEHLRDGRERSYSVCLLEKPGPAYTQDEWEADARADWCLDADGSWLFQGRVPHHCSSYRVNAVVKEEN
jgi:hypothetical protein